MTAAFDGPVVDSPRDWVAADIQTYVEAGADASAVFGGMPLLLLTTRGRRTGTLRRTPLVYGRDGDRYVLVAADAGAPVDPSWFANLTADPQVELLVGAESFTGQARAATTEERTALWPRMTAIFPTFVAHQDATDRELPLVVVDPGLDD